MRIAVAPAPRQTNLVLHLVESLFFKGLQWSGLCPHMPCLD